MGETLADESRLWKGWADWLGIPPLTLFGVVGGVIARGQHHREAFRLLRPDLDVDAETRRRRRADPWTWPEDRDLYPDARPALRVLQEAGVRIGLAGNQSPEEEVATRALDLPLDFVGSSASWGAEKPSPLFFERLIEAGGGQPSEIAYVGDRIDNDVLPAARAGLQAIFLRRGPWAWLQAGRSTPDGAVFAIESLRELPQLLTPIR